MSTVTPNAANVPLANQGGKGTARPTVQAHGLVSPGGTPQPDLGGVAANQGQQGSEVTGNGDASTSQQGSPIQEQPVNSQSKPEYSEVMPDEEVEEILGIKVIPTVDQTEEVGKIYLTKAPLLVQEEDGLQSKFVS
jgi:hypothetical protein